MNKNCLLELKVTSKLCLAVNKYLKQIKRTVQNFGGPPFGSTKSSGVLIKSASAEGNLESCHLPTTLKYLPSTLSPDTAV